MFNQVLSTVSFRKKYISIYKNVSKNYGVVVKDEKGSGFIKSLS